jgi:predicted transcriptional regulator
LVKTATGRPVTVAVVKIGITGDPGYGSDYVLITATAIGCTSLVVLAV